MLELVASASAASSDSQYRGFYAEHAAEQIQQVHFGTGEFLLRISRGQFFLTVIMSHAFLDNAEIAKSPGKIRMTSEPASNKLLRRAF